MCLKGGAGNSLDWRVHTEGLDEEDQELCLRRKNGKNELLQSLTNATLGLVASLRSKFACGNTGRGREKCGQASKGVWGMSWH